jgi:hypothetical protein
MKRIVSCLSALLLYAPLAVAQAPSDESAPDEPEVPMISLPPEQLPQSEGVDADNPDRPFFPYTRVPRDAPAKPRTIPKLSPPVPGIDQGNLPPGYVARAQCYLLYEEEIENGAAIFGIKPNKVKPEGGPWEDWYPKVCRQKSGDELPPTPPPPQPTNWANKLPSGYAARAARCDEGEEEVENGAAVFGLEPIKIRWDEQLVDWLPKVCCKKG